MTKSTAKLTDLAEVRVSVKYTENIIDFLRVCFKLESEMFVLTFAEKCLFTRKLLISSINVLIFDLFKNFFLKSSKGLGYIKKI